MAAARKCDRCGSYYEKGVANMYKYEEDGVLYPVNAIRIGLWNAKSRNGRTYASQTTSVRHAPK